MFLVSFCFWTPPLYNEVLVNSVLVIIYLFDYWINFQCYGMHYVPSWVIFSWWQSLFVTYYSSYLVVTISNTINSFMHMKRINLTVHNKLTYNALKMIWLPLTADSPHCIPIWVFWIKFWCCSTCEVAGGICSYLTKPSTVCKLCLLVIT